MTKKKPTIAIFHCGFVYSGGGERIVIEEALGLLRRGYRIEVYTPTIDKKLCYPEALNKLHVKRFLPGLPSYFPAQHALLMIFSSVLAPLIAFRFNHIDCFIGANQPGAWIAWCISKVLKKPYIVYMNQPNRLLYPRKIDEEVKWQNLKEYYYIDSLIKKLRFFVDWADRVSFTSSKSILTNGGYIGRIIESIYKVKTINCSAGTYLQEEKYIKNNVNEPYQGRIVIKNISGQSFKIQKPYILTTNRHVPQKKFEYALEAIAKLRKKHKKATLVIPGPFTTYTKTLLSLAKRINVQDHIFFLHQVSESTLQKLYQHACVYVYTAPEEDFGMGIIEAMGWGVPVVAWKAGGPTITVKNGETGYLVNTFNTENFAYKISTLLANRELRKKMSESALEHIKNNFSWEKHINVIEQNIDKVLVYHRRRF